MSISRRDFLKNLGAVGAASTVTVGATASLNACSSSGSTPANQNLNNGGNNAPRYFLHSVASGDPLATQVILWTRISNVSTPTAVQWRVSSTRDMQNIIASGMVTTNASRDYTVKVDVMGLSSATTYYYDFSFGGETTPTARTRTLPAASAAVARLRFGLISCSSYPHGFFNAYRFVARRHDLDAVLCLGDYIYEYAGRGLGPDPADYGDGRMIGRAPTPPREIINLADYRERHSCYKLDQDLQALHLQHPLIAIWDDHEFADNSDPVGALNHQPAADGVWATRRDAAKQAYFEWMPIRDSGSFQIYRNFQFGNLANLILLDTRMDRPSREAAGNGAPLANTGFTTFYYQTGSAFDRAPAAGTERRLISPAQETWLGNQLANTATWKILGQQIMFGQLKLVGQPNAVDGPPGTGSQYINTDQWDGYPFARENVYRLLKTANGGNPVQNTVILTGDIHTSWAMDIAEDVNNPLTGYNPATGANSLAVEYVVPSVTSPGLDALVSIQDSIRTQNPHIKYVDLSQHGYVVLDITPNHAQAEWYYVSQINARGGSERFATAYKADVIGGAVTVTRAVEVTTPSVPDSTKPPLV